MHQLHSKWRKPEKVPVSKKSDASKQKMKNYWKKKKELENTSAISNNETRLEDVSDENKTEYCKTENKSAKEKKLDLFIKTNENGSEKSTSDQYILVHSTAFKNLMPKCFCQFCKKITTVTFETGEHQGFAVLLKLICDSCNKIISRTYSSPHATSSKKSSYDVNKRVVESFLKIGAGFSAALDFCASLSMKPMSSNGYYLQLKTIKSDAEALKKSVLEKSRKVALKVHQNLCLEESNTNIFDILAAFDGTWQKRGHSSLYGLGCVVDVLTGLVIDYEVLSKYCHLCNKTANDIGADSPDFHFWQKGHKQCGDCCENYFGSSSSMEMASAEIMWKRSVKECSMRYMTLLADGDSKTMKHLQGLNVYGEPIKKEECLNHVSKRLYSGLIELVKVCKVKGITLGGKKKGALTAQVISLLSNYYRSAIVRNKTDVEAMRKDILATLSHCSSTNEEPNHSDCPTGLNSWCFYNRALANRQVPQSHTLMKVVLNKLAVEYMKPVYERLTQLELLKNCSQGLTQNSNESLHSVIWRKCPKTTFVSKGRIEFAAANAIAEFNMGQLEAAKCFSNVTGAPLSVITKSILEKRDNERKRRSVLKNEAEQKKRRIERKYSKRQKEANKVRLEGDTYGAGLF